jgi:hypothetical protein
MNKNRKYNVWHIDAYAGWNDYDGPEDCNFRKDVVFDKMFSKQDVIDMWCALHSESRCVAVSKVYLVKEVEELEEPVQEKSKEERINDIWHQDDNALLKDYYYEMTMFMEGMRSWCGSEDILEYCLENNNIVLPNDISIEDMLNSSEPTKYINNK